MIVARLKAREADAPARPDRGALMRTMRAIVQGGALAGLTGTARAVLVYASVYARWSSCEVDLPAGTIAAALRTNRSLVRSALRELVSRGILERLTVGKSGGRASRFRLLSVGSPTGPHGPVCRPIDGPAHEPMMDPPTGPNQVSAGSGSPLRGEPPTSAAPAAALGGGPPRRNNDRRSA